MNRHIPFVRISLAATLAGALLDAETGAELAGYRAHDSYVFALAWTPDGTRLVSCSGDGMSINIPPA